MKPVRIVPAGDRRTFVPMELPVDKDGNRIEYDDKGEPVDGCVPASFEVPRYDFISEDDFDGLQKDLKDLDKRKIPQRTHGREVTLVMFRRFVSDETYKLLSGLYTGELDQLVEAWRENSQTSLGESPASANS